MKTTWIWIILGPAALLAALFLTARPEARAASPAALTLGLTEVSEGDDFATRTIALPWDMNSAPYPDLFTAVKNVNQAAFKVTANGFWDMRATNTDPRLWLHWTGVGTTQRVLKMGDTYPIDASRYRLLSYYMCLDEAPAPNDFSWGSIVYWMYDRTPHDDPNNGISKFLLFVNQGRFKNDGDCELLTYDLGRPSAWMTGAWNNSPNKPLGLRLDPINVAGADFKIGWVRLTTRDTTNIVPISWSGAPAGTNQFFVSLTGCGQEGVLLGTKDGTSGTFNWGGQIINGPTAAHPLPLPESFEPGTYHVYMKDSAGAVACAGNNPLRVHAAPRLEFQKPSRLSGPDFASEMIGDAWGMANSEDVEQMVSVTAFDFDDGILSLTAEDTDPRLFLNLDGLLIPTAKYRYASFRFQIVGDHEAGSGWIQRWVWWYSGGAGVDNVTTQDMQIYENWHTYTIDLETAPMENCSGDCWSGTPQVFRFDPFEIPKPTKLLIDYAILTGSEAVDQGEKFPIYYSTAAAGNAVVRFYYDTDTNPSNGRTLIGSTAVSAGSLEPAAPVGTTSLFFPHVQSRDLSELGLYANSELFMWDTSGVPKAVYYISADVDDGVMVTTWYSELPVTIK